MNPNDVNIYQTTTCNYKCSHCLRQTDNNILKAVDVTSTVINNVITMFPTIKNACIAGFGEPLCSRNVFDIIKFLSSKNVGCSLITNGSLITKRKDEFKDLNFQYIAVSLNTVSKEKHKKITQTDTFDDVISGIKWLVSQKRWPIVLSFIAFKKAISEIPEFIKLANSLGVSYCTIVNSLPYNKGSIPDIIKEDDLNIIKQLNEYKKLPGAGIIRKWPIPIKKIPNHNCSSPTATIGVNGNNLFTGCRRVLPPSELLTTGCWNGDYINELRLSVKGKGRYSYICNNCFGNSKG